MLMSRWFFVEQVTRIELALSAWEAVRYVRSDGFTSHFG